MMFKQKIQISFIKFIRRY